jgi:hypothetical protein
VVLAVGLTAILALFAFEMSQAAPRTAGSDHAGDQVFATVIPGGGSACQDVTLVPRDVGAVQLLIGTYGRPLPPIRLRFLSAGGRIVAAGSLAGGGPQGEVKIPFSRVSDPSLASRACLHVSGPAKVALAGVAGTADLVTVNGKPQPASISLIYVRPGRETWWQLLPTLGTRFGLGKASFFGGWTLPAMAALLLAVWAGAIRLLWRELP